MRRSGVGIRLLLAVLLAGALVAVPRGVRFQPDPATLPNVIFILLDTMRADGLGVYSNTPRATPFIDNWAAASIVYERAYAPSSWTIPSIASLFLAQYPSEHGVIKWQAALPERDLTLAEILHQNGFHTGAFSANPQIAATNGFSQGFERFRLISKPEFGAGDATRLNRAALAWVDRLTRAPGVRRPFFLYLQYMATHAPYRFHPEITPPPPGDLGTTDDELNTRLHNGAIAIALGDRHPWQFSAKEVERLRALYDGEAAYLDAALADLFEHLAARGVMDRSLVIITADHGEEFGEHGEFMHGADLFEPAIHVPLIIRMPGRARGQLITVPVQLSGLPAALLEQLGIPPPPAFRVRPLPGMPAHTQPPRPAVQSELIPVEAHTFRLHRHALIRGTEKLLVTQSGENEYYDLARDPGEMHPIARPAFAADLQLRLAQLTKEMREPSHPSLVPIDDATRRRLRSLGYVQ